MIRANLLVIAFLLIAGCGYFALDRAVANKPDGPRFTGLSLRDGSREGTTMPTPDEFEREAAPYREAAKSATFKVAYHETSRVLDRTSVTERVIYQESTERKREDLTTNDGVRLQTFELDGEQFFCGLNRDESCLSNEAFQDLVDGLFRGGFVAASSSITRPLATASLDLPPSRPRSTPQITKYDMHVLDQATTCIHEIAGEYERISCFNTEGVPLYEHFSYRDILVTKEATELVRSVSDADFDLPYPVVVPTPKPISPLG